MATESNDVDEIYHRMAVIRREHHTNVRESVAGAEAMADWGRYTWTYPWIAVGAAAAVGYLIYTSGRQKAVGNNATLVDGAGGGEPVAAVGTRGRGPSWASRSLLLGVWDILSPVAIRAGQNYMLHWLENQFRPSTFDRADRWPSGGEQGDSLDRAERSGPDRSTGFNQKTFFGG